MLSVCGMILKNHLFNTKIVFIFVKQYRCGEKVATQDLKKNVL
jgi:hypothetical protein